MLITAMITTAAIIILQLPPPPPTLAPALSDARRYLSSLFCHAQGWYCLLKNSRKVSHRQSETLQMHTARPGVHLCGGVVRGVCVSVRVRVSVCMLVRACACACVCVCVCALLHHAVPKTISFERCVVMYFKVFISRPRVV